MRAGTAWLMWSIPAALFLVAFFHRNAPGVMARDLMETFGVTGAVIGLLSSTYFYSYAGFMIPGGLLIDAFGARRVVAAGGAVMGLGTLAGAAASPPPALRRLLRGIGRVLANAHTWPVFLSFFCLYSAMGNLFLWAVPFLRDVYGLATTPAATIAAATSIALLGSAPLTGFVSDSVVRRRKSPYVALSVALLGVWALFLGTLGAAPLWAVAALFSGLGLFGGVFVLTWPIGREVNPPELAGIAVAVVNHGGFLGAALTQGPLGAVLDARWAGAVTAGGARAYPLDAYPRAFATCTALVLGATLLSLLLRETRGRNVWQELAPGTPGRT